MIKLYGIPLSNNVNKVRYCLNHLELDYQHIPTSPLTGENQTEEFKAMSPFGKVPAIEIDGLKLFESNAINRYLAGREKSSLYPDSLEKKALVDAWLDFGSIHIGAAQARVTFNRVLAPFMEAEADESSLKTGVEFLAKYLPVVDAQLSKNKYLTGDALTLADINLLAVLDPSEVSQIDLAPYAHILKWRKSLQGEPFYQKCYKDFTQFLQEAMNAKA